MRIVIDMQGLQAYGRELPDELIAFCRSLALNRGDHEIFFLLDAACSDSIEPIRSAFQGILPQDHLHLWYSPSLQAVRNDCQDTHRILAKALHSAAINALLPDIVHQTLALCAGANAYPFDLEGLAHEATLSIGVVDNFESGCDLDSEQLETMYQSIIQYSEYFHFRFAILHPKAYEELASSLDRLNLITEAPRTSEEWQALCLRLFEAWEAQSASWLYPQSNEAEPNRGRLKRLAFVSPLPPLQTGIADYSAELVPALSQYFEITVISDQLSLVRPHQGAEVDIRSDEWFQTNHREFDFVLYQLGNSEFHAYMVPLIRQIPGVVVLHEAILDNLCFVLRDRVPIYDYAADALYAAFGYRGLTGNVTHHESQQSAKFSILDLLNAATGIIVHSEHCHDILAGLYGSIPSGKIDIIPLVRAPASPLDKSLAKAGLGFKEGDYLVCSFGNLNPFKRPERLLDCWLASSLSRDPRCYLVFVGPCANHYGESFRQIVKDRALEDRVLITGAVSADLYRSYLSAADVAVQLRCNSHGETSAAVADCMNYALPLIVNCHGTASELDDDVAIKIPDLFLDSHLTQGLECLRSNSNAARSLGVRARDCLLRTASPSLVAAQYRDTIQSSRALLNCHASVLADRIAASVPALGDAVSLRDLAKSISITIPEPRHRRCIYIDVTETRRNDLRTGVQRVVRAIVSALLNSPLSGYRIEPVFFSHEHGEWLLRFARGYTLDLINSPCELLRDDVCEPSAGDIFLCLDLCIGCVLGVARQGLFADYRNRGVRVAAVVYDLLPILLPQAFPKESAVYHLEWLREISRFDELVCISQSVADELRIWLAHSDLPLAPTRQPNVTWFHLGADILFSCPSRGLPSSHQTILSQLDAAPTFLMVGTVEPRKGHLQVLRAFISLWNDGVSCNLVIVGKQGWDGQTSDVADTVSMLRNSRELHKRLFWLEAISDEYLEQVYSASSCLIAASYGEGFGLPLIEAAQHSLPIIARDIPVFREVAGDSAFYFSDRSPESLAKTLLNWLALYNEGRHPSSAGLAWLTWEQSANMLMEAILPSDQ